MPASDVEVDGEDVSHDESNYLDLGDASDDEEADVLWRLLQQARRRQQNPTHSRENSLDDRSSVPISGPTTQGGSNAFGDFLDDDGAVSGLDMELDFGDLDHDYDNVGNVPEDDPEDADLGGEGGNESHSHRRRTGAHPGDNSSNFDPGLNRLEPTELFQQLLP